MVLKEATRARSTRKYIKSLGGRNWKLILLLRRCSFMQWFFTRDNSEYLDFADHPRYLPDLNWMEPHEYPQALGPVGAVKALSARLYPSTRRKNQSRCLEKFGDRAQAGIEEAI